MPAFALTALVAPAGESRRPLAVAFLLEAVCASYTAVHWFLPLVLGR